MKSATSCVKLTLSLALPLLMCCFVQLTTAKSYFNEGSIAKKLSSSHLPIQPMLPYSVSGKRRAPYLHYPNQGTFFISIIYIGSNSLAALDNKLITGSHIPVLS